MCMKEPVLQKQKSDTLNRNTQVANTNEYKNTALNK